MPENNTVMSAISRLIKATGDQTATVVEKCPEAKRLAQPGENKATPLWLIGHLANVGDYLGNVLGLGMESMLPGDWRKKFNPSQFGGTPITANAADYPSWDEVAETYGKVMTRLAEGVAALSDDDLTGPAKGKVPEQLQSAMKTIENAITICLLHDSHHRGQIALLANSAD